MLREAVAYPRGGEEAVRRLLVGGGLTFLAFLIVLPVIPLAGYVARSIARVAKGASEPPGFEDAQRLLVGGAKAIGVGIAYLLPGWVGRSEIVAAIGLLVVVPTWTIVEWRRRTFSVSLRWPIKLRER